MKIQNLASEPDEHVGRIRPRARWGRVIFPPSKHSGSVLAPSLETRSSAEQRTQRRQIRAPDLRQSR
jgi:hypothetical protein